jgi:hypothetical protein
MMIRLANPSFLLIGVIFLALFLRKREVAFLGYSHLNLLEGEKSPRFWHPLSKVLLVLVISLMVLEICSSSMEKFGQAKELSRTGYSPRHGSVPQHGKRI